jgi:GWxTD domain-containing protein
VKSSWISCAAASWLLAAAALAAPQGRDASELTNFQLSPEHSQWLVGAISWIANEDEIQAYLALSDDRAAESFITEFWSRHSSADVPWPAEQPRALYERRAAEADRRFSEGARLGRCSDRGAIFVLYGDPEEVSFEMPTRQTRRAQEPLEIWTYSKEAAAGLDGQRPRRKYFFLKQSGVTAFSSPKG